MRCLTISVMLWATLGSSAAIDTRAHSTFRGSFYASTHPAQYDLRFSRQSLPPSKLHEAQSYLMKAYLSTVADLGVVTWLVHGSLLGWYWNRRILPWSSGLDVQTTIEDMQHLSEHYSMTTYHFTFPGSDIRRDYLLEVKSELPDKSTADAETETSARWIDMNSGLYIDIKPLRCREKANAEAKDLMARRNERFSVHGGIFPLRDTTFEGVTAKVPYAFADFLKEEYGLLH